MHVLKDLSGNLCGTFAYVEDSDKLVVGEKTEQGREIIFEGSIETFINSNRMRDLTKTDPQLALIISGYYTRQKFNVSKTIEEHFKEKTMTRTTKLCEIKVTEGAESFKELVFQLTANGYRVDAAPVYKEFPKTGLDYWMIAIFDKEKQ